MRLLLVEDDVMVASGIKLGLTGAGYAVDWVGSAERALEVTRSEAFDLAVIDIGLPGMDGLVLTQNLRKEGHAMPVLILTARDALQDRVQGLDAGADDYLVKPFAPEELAARLRAVGRRSGGGAESRRRITGAELKVEVDLAERAAYLDDKRVELTGREWAVLEALLLRAGRIVSKTELEKLVLGFETELASNALEVHVSALRRKLGRGVIETLRGIGYRLEALP